MAVKSVIPILLVIVVLFHSCYQQRNLFFVMSPDMASYRTYPGHPFCESVEIARFIKQQTGPDDRIAVLGSEPQIFFYADRRSATGYIYTYPLMEPHPYAVKMQQEMIEEIETSSPEFLVFVTADVSWVVGLKSELMIFKWANEYIRKYYRLVGVIDMVRPGETNYRWQEKAIAYSPRSRNYLRIYRRGD